MDRGSHIISQLSRHAAVIYHGEILLNVLLLLNIVILTWQERLFNVFLMASW